MNTELDDLIAWIDFQIDRMRIDAGDGDPVSRTQIRAASTITGLELARRQADFLRRTQ